MNKDLQIKIIETIVFFTHLIFVIYIEYRLFKIRYDTIQRIFSDEFFEKKEEKTERNNNIS